MIVAGSIIGWLAAFMFRTDGTSHGLQLNIATGIAGALFGGLLVSPLLGTGELAGGRYIVGAMLVAKLVAAVFVVTLNLVRSRAFG